MHPVPDGRPYSGPEDAADLERMRGDAEARRDADALFLIAEAYRLSRRIPDSQRKAEGLYRLSSELGSADADHFMYRMLGKGMYGRPRDPEGAMEHLIRAADGGCVKAQLEMARRCHLGDGVPASDEKALKYSEEAFRTDPGPDSTWMYACMLLTAGDDASLEMSYRLLTSLIITRCGYVARAYALIGYVHEHHTGYLGSFSDAAEAYTAVIRNTMFCTRATARLGDLYFEGRGVERSFIRALLLYRFAATPGYGYVNDVMAYRIGELCRTGVPDVLEPDPETAWYWYSLSASEGYGPAGEAMKRMFPDRVPEHVSYVDPEYPGDGYRELTPAEIFSPETHSCLPGRAVYRFVFRY